MQGTVFVFAAVTHAENGQMKTGSAVRLLCVDGDAQARKAPLAGQSRCLRFRKCMYVHARVRVCVRERV
jgi:hypothetical protein